MKASELRVGNYVMHKKVKLPIIINVNNLLAIANGSDLYEPIKLTSHILIKSGAVSKPNGYFIGKLKFTLNTIELIRFHYSGKVQWLRYVHELQNLVFALTNDDITINF